MFSHLVLFFFNIVFLWLHDSKSRPLVNYIVIYLGTVGMVWVERKCSIRGCITMNTIANFGTLLLYTARFSQTHCMCVPPPPTHAHARPYIHTYTHTVSSPGRKKTQQALNVCKTFCKQPKQEDPITDKIVILESMHFH